MSKRAIKNNIQRNNENRNTFMDMVVADPNTRRLYITSSTAVRAKQGNAITLGYIKKYQEKYPDFQIVEDNRFYLNFIGFIPA